MNRIHVTQLLNKIFNKYVGRSYCLSIPRWEIPLYCLLGLRIPHIQAISGKGDQNIPMPYQIITRHCSHNSSYIMQILSELLELTRQT